MAIGVRRLTAAPILAAWIASGAAAQPAPDPAVAQMATQPTTPAPIPGWTAFVDGLRDLPAAVLASLPQQMRTDPQVQQEAVRLVLEALAARSLEAISADADHPTFLPASNVTLNIRQPNADTIYKRARIAPGGVYRLRGHKGSLRLARIGQYVPASGDADIATGVLIAGDFDLNALATDAQGRFDVLLSPTRPSGHTGDWWKLDPRATQLGLRQLASDWAKERDPTISIERLDAPVERPRLSREALQRRLHVLGVTTTSLAMSFVERAAELRREGYINRLRVFDAMAGGQALDGQSYYEGAYILDSGEALIVEAKVPSRCLYHSALLTNSLYETTDWYNNHSSLNDSQTRIDSDGVLRIVVSTRDPGVPNWLDTAGHPSGVIQGRWMGCDVQPAPTARKVAFADIRKSLPADTPTVTPAQRQAIIRERRAALQQRPLW